MMNDILEHLRGPKICTTCGSKKLLSDYYIHGKYRTGHMTQCKECCREYSRKRSQKKLRKTDSRWGEGLTSTERSRVFRAKEKPVSVINAFLSMRI